jgi:hypothetical protein
LISPALSATPGLIVDTIEYGEDGGFISSRYLDEFTVSCQTPHNPLGTTEIYLQFFDQNLPLVGGEIPYRYWTFSIPNEGSTHVVFKVNAYFAWGITWGLSDDPTSYSAAGNGPNCVGSIFARQ